MRVEYCETVEVNGYAIISIEDIEAGIRDSVESVKAIDDGYNQRQKAFQINSFLNTIFQCLEGFPPELRTIANEEVRRKFAEALHEHADHWAQPRQDSNQ